MFGKHNYFYGNTMITIQNHRLKAQIEPKGAELQSLYDTKTNQEYMWKGDPAFWGKHSPILFPIVGALKDDSYTYNGQTYKLPRHGFARDMIFEVETTNEAEAVFVLTDSQQTKAFYPFDFRLEVRYRLVENTIQVSYRIFNPARETLYFSIGGHPAFAVPLVPGTEYQDYYLEFSEPETVERWPISGNLIDITPQPFLATEAKIPLRKELFYEDAIVLKDLSSEAVSLLSEKTDRGLKFAFRGFPYLGIWAAKDAHFICIEPWCGIADSVTHNGELEEKEGIIELAGNTEWEKNWMVECL